MLPAGDAPAPPSLRENLAFSLGACLVALAGIAFWTSQTKLGAPFVHHPDEPPVLARALKMLVDDDWNPQWFRYPSLYFYVQAFAASVLHGLGGPPLDPGTELFFEGAR